MTSKLNIPTISKVNEVADSNKMKSLVGRKMTKTTKFMGEDLSINKLLVSEVLRIQALAAEAEADEKEGFRVLKEVIKLGCPEATELTDDEFNNFPLDELTTLSDEIMAFSGLSGKGK